VSLGREGALTFFPWVNKDRFGGSECCRKLEIDRRGTGRDVTGERRKKCGERALM
jgi:hypothetical protein